MTRSDLLGARIRLARLEVGLSQGALAALIPCDKQSISRWERSCCTPRFSALYRLAEVLGVTTDWLAGGAR